MQNEQIGWLGKISYSVAQYALHIKKEACVDSSEVLTLEVVQAKAALAVFIIRKICYSITRYINRLYGD